MIRKRVLESDFFEGYSLITIVSSLPDFRMSYFLNQYLNIKLKKYDDFSLFPDKKASFFSWYFYADDILRQNFYLFKNKNKEDFLLPSLYKFDYLLLFHENSQQSILQQAVISIRKIPHVSAAFQQNLAHIKLADMLIEQNELHVTKQHLPQ